MKRTISFLIVFVGVLGLALAVYAVADQITLDRVPGGAKPVPFNHKAHADAAKCVDCHHANPDAPKPCFDCHDDKDAANGGGHKYKETMHNNCGKKCHTEAAAAGKNAPTFPGNCPKCHTP